MHTENQITSKRLPTSWFSLCVCCLALLVTGCTKEQIYESIKNSKQLECEKAPPDEYRECMRAVSDTYDEYRRKKEEAEEETEEDEADDKK